MHDTQELELIGAEVVSGQTGWKGWFIRNQLELGYELVRRKIRFGKYDSENNVTKAAVAEIDLLRKRVEELELMHQPLEEAPLTIPTHCGCGDPFPPIEDGFIHTCRRCGQSKRGASREWRPGEIAMRLTVGHAD